MRHLRFVLSVAIVAILCSSLLAQTSSVSYYMNGSGSPVNLTSTSAGPLSLNGSSFTASPVGTAVTGTDNNVGTAATPNQALRYNVGTNFSISFSVTNNTSNLGWEISSYGFDINTDSGVSGSYALFVDTGSGFNQVASGNVGSLANPIWRAIADPVTPTIILLPSATDSFRIDFSNFTGTGGFAVDSVFLAGGSFAAVPEPASIAMICLTGAAVASGWYIRRRRSQKSLNESLTRI